MRNFYSLLFFSINESKSKLLFYEMNTPVKSLHSIKIKPWSFIIHTYSVIVRIRFCAWLSIFVFKDINVISLSDIKNKVLIFYYLFLQDLNLNFA